MKKFSSSLSPVAFYGIIGGLVILFMAQYGSSGGIYVGWHLNVGGPYLKTFYPTNEEKEDDKRFVSMTGDIKGFSPETQDKEFENGLNALKDIVDQAESDGKRLRAYGSRWTVSELPYTQDYMIDTYGLNYVKVGIESDDDVEEKYEGERKELLAFVQGGVVIKQLYKALFAKGLTIQTSQTTDGATLAGSVSTGSHDAAVLFGSMAEMVRGIHVVLPGKTVYLQRSSDPVLIEDYVINTLKADELMSDDALFNAALVSMGTFGVVHGYLIETERLYRLKVEVIDNPFSISKDALYSLDPAEIAALGFDLDNPSELPWIIQSAVNPLRLEKKKGSRVRVMQKVPLSNDEIEQVKASGASYVPVAQHGDQDPALVLEEAVHALERKMSALSPVFTTGLIGRNIRRLLFGEFAAVLRDYLWGVAGFGGEGYPIDLFSQVGSDGYFVIPPIPTTTMELCTPIEDLETVFDLILEIMYDHPNPTILDLRYTPSSNATLAPSRFDGSINVWISFSSIDTFPDARIAYKLVQKALEEHRDDFSFTYHWGKAIPVNDEWPIESHGSAAIKDWKEQREKLLPTRELRHLFSNDFTDKLGLTGE